MAKSSVERRILLYFMDVIYNKVKTNNLIVSKTAYVVVGIDDDGFKIVLGIWISANETSKV